MKEGMLEGQKGTSAEAEVKNEEEAGEAEGKGRSFTECCVLCVVCCVLCVVCCVLCVVCLTSHFLL